MAGNPVGTGGKKSPRSAVLDSRPEYERLGRWLRAQREAAGLQQKPLSRSLGKPEQYVNKIELGRQRIDVVEFLDLCAALKLDQGLTFKELMAAVGSLDPES